MQYDIGSFANQQQDRIPSENQSPHDQQPQSHQLSLILDIEIVTDIGCFKNQD